MPFHHFKKVSACIVILASATSFVGCTGSSKKVSDSKITDPQEPVIEEQETTLISGNVVKGTVKNALVEFFQIENGVPSTKPFASTYTNELGQYSVEVDNSNIDDFVYIVAKGQRNLTQMVCDAQSCGSVDIVNGIDSNNDGFINLGESLYLTEQFELSSAISQFDTTEQISTNLTPLTHIAVERALAEGNFSKININYHMGLLSNLFNLPQTLTRLGVMDVSKLEKVIQANQVVDNDSLIYGAFSAMVAEYAHENELTIEAALKDVSSNLYVSHSTFNRTLVVSLLNNALASAQLLAANDPEFQQLIADIRLLIFQYECEVNAEEDCSDITPTEPNIPNPDDLATVKSFVSDFRHWSRDATINAEAAVDDFSQRVDVVDNIWENDLKQLSGVLNSLLPGIAQTVSPNHSGCYYCSDRLPLPTWEAIDQKTLRWKGLTFTLYTSGVMTIQGERNDVEVDMDLFLPPLNEWKEAQSIAVTAGRLTHGSTDLVLTEGTQIGATYDDGITFEQLADQISDPNFDPTPDALALEGNFFLQANYAITPSATLDFEPSQAEKPVRLSGDWAISQDRASSGEYSLRSRRIGHYQTSQTSATFETYGGFLSFDYAIESENRYDFIKLYVNNRQVWSTSGYQPYFNRKAIHLTPGTHTITWEYYKDGSVSRHQDAAWIDNIQFPALVGTNLPEEIRSKTVLNGTLSASAENLHAYWARSINGYLPSHVAINAVFNHEYNEEYESDTTSADDQISLSFAADISNAASFVPPQELDPGTLSIIGQYEVTDSVFTLTLPQTTATIEKQFNSKYLVQYFESGNSEPVNSFYRYFDDMPLAEVAGRIFPNSAIGWETVAPEQGLYITTLLNNSPWSHYSDSQFSDQGGNIYGLLIEGFEPTETEDQFLNISVAMEITADLEGLDPMTFGTTLTREELNSGDLAFYVKHDGHRFNFASNVSYQNALYNQNESVDLEDPYFSILNEHGVLMKVNGSGSISDLKDIEGELILNGVVYGTIEHVKGLTIIKYIDGSGESIE